MNRRGLYLPPLAQPQRVVGKRAFDFSRQVAVMAIINRTPDSFYDKGRTFALDKAISAARRALAEGADWIDIGGVPFGPGPEVSASEEIRRVVPVVEALREAPDAASPPAPVPSTTRAACATRRWPASWPRARRAW
jgi:dihydropteroate synthase